MRVSSLFLSVFLILSQCPISSVYAAKADIISISSSQQIYALAKILAPEGVKKKLYGYANGTESLPNDLFSLFEDANLNNTTFNTQADKAAYLASASYRLDEDIQLSISTSICNDGSFYFGIGSSEHPFKGTFDGNNKNIILSGNNVDSTVTNIYYPAQRSGLFAYAQGASISNVRLISSSDITFTNAVQLTQISFGLIVGAAYAYGTKGTEIANCSIELDGCRVGYVDSKAFSSGNKGFIFGGFAGQLGGYSKLTGCNLTMKNNACMEMSGALTGNDLTSSFNYKMGGLVGDSVGTPDTGRNTITNCTLSMNNSDLISNCQRGLIAGIASYASFTDLTETTVNLTNSSIGITSIGEAYESTGYEYVSVAAGGILGFAAAGALNGPTEEEKATYGRSGVIIKDCDVISVNSNYNDAVFAEAESASATNVGGILAIAFNNCTIDSCDVSVTNGTFRSERSTTKNLEKSFAPTCGGIAGRIEHTGRIYNCNVYGNEFSILSKGNGKLLYAGGIVGTDVGPHHKNQISMENNTFDGNGTSQIVLERVGVDDDSCSYLYAGGLAGHTTYIVKDCEVKDTSVYFLGQKPRGWGVKSLVADFANDSRWSNPSTRKFDTIDVNTSTYQNTEAINVDLPTETSTPALVSISDYAISEEGKTLTELASGKTIDVSAIAMKTNNNTEKQAISFILGFYRNNGKSLLTDIKKVTIELKDGDLRQQINFSVQVPDGSETMKIFAIESLTSLKPLSNAVVFPKLIQ